MACASCNGAAPAEVDNVFAAAYEDAAEALTSFWADLWASETGGGAAGGDAGDADAGGVQADDPPAVRRPCWLVILLAVALVGVWLYYREG